MQKSRGRWLKLRLRAYSHQHESSRILRSGPSGVRGMGAGRGLVAPPSRRPNGGPLRRNARRSSVRASAALGRLEGGATKATVPLTSFPKIRDDSCPLPRGRSLMRVAPPSRRPSAAPAGTLPSGLFRCGGLTICRQGRRRYQQPPGMPSHTIPHGRSEPLRLRSLAQWLRLGGRVSIPNGSNESFRLLRLQYSMGSGLTPEIVLGSAAWKVAKRLATFQAALPRILHWS